MGYCGARYGLPTAADNVRVTKLARPHEGVKTYVVVKRGTMSGNQEWNVDQVRTQDFDHVWHPMMQHAGMTKDDLLMIVSADGCEQPFHLQHARRARLALGAARTEPIGPDDEAVAAVSALGADASRLPDCALALPRVAT